MPCILDASAWLPPKHFAALCETIERVLAAPTPEYGASADVARDVELDGGWTVRFGLEPYTDLLLRYVLYPEQHRVKLLSVTADMTGLDDFLAGDD